MSTLTTSDFIGELPDGQILIYEEILRGAPQLRNLAFDTSMFVDDDIYLRSLTGHLVLVNNISHLTSLRITRALPNNSESSGHSPQYSTDER
jgi:hypothetical protein